VLHLHNIPTWLALVLSSIVALIAAILVQLFLVPWQKKKIIGEMNNSVKFTFGDSDGEIFFFVSQIYFLIIELNTIRFFSEQQS
jgi:hypothetical protein